MKIQNYIMYGLTVFILMAAFVLVSPTKTHAFSLGNIIDPLCLFACDEPELPPLPGLPGFSSSNDRPRTVNNTYNNSNNVNSNINSPNGTVNAVNTVAGSGAKRSITQSVQTPSYDYSDTYNPPYYPPQQNYHESLKVSCYPTPLYAEEGETVRWHANAYGGDGSYNYSWDGTNGLSGSGSSISKRYNSEGYKNATVRVRSGGQTVTKNCDGSVYIYEEDRGHDYDDDYYYPPHNNYYPISVSCTSNVASAYVGNTIRWTAYVSGGYDDDYSIRWNGTDGLSGSGSSASIRYNTPGQKYASITVRYDGQSVTQYCANTVQIVGQVYAAPVPTYPQYQTQGLDVACIVDPISARVNQPVTWKSEVAGGYAPYTYTWTGTDGLTGSGSSVIKYYSKTGNKSAIVSVRSADGKTATVACSNSTTVRSAAVAAPAKPVPPPPPQYIDEDNDMSASALFSLENVPWGWVAILIILVLFATVVYLIYNRPKI